MRIGVALQEPSGPEAMTKLRDDLQRAADDGFTSAWLSNIFGLDALTALAVAGSQVPGIEVGTAVVPTYPRHPAVLAQQARTVTPEKDAGSPFSNGTRTARYSRMCRTGRPKS